jgi:hypothetical protein
LARLEGELGASEKLFEAHSLEIAWYSLELVASEEWGMRHFPGFVRHSSGCAWSEESFGLHSLSFGSLEGRGMEREGPIEWLEGQGMEREGDFGPRFFGGMRSEEAFGGRERRGTRRGERFARHGGGGMRLAKRVGFFGERFARLGGGGMGLAELFGLFEN